MEETKDASSRSTSWWPLSLLQPASTPASLANNPGNSNVNQSNPSMEVSSSHDHRSDHTTLHPVDPPYIEPPPYWAVIMAGGIGGSTADFTMHSIDTVKTRLQGQPFQQAKYTGFLQTYRTLMLEEGVRRGLYGGWPPAMLGSLSGTMIYFGVYEWTKRMLIGHNTPDSLAHLAAGAFGDFVASVVFVPSEVLKTRLQLQGRYNNPYFISGYNYRSLPHAIRTIVRVEGPTTLYHGYQATLLRDVPFSALQFAFYERLKVYALAWWQQKYKHSDAETMRLGLPASTELIVGAIAGGTAGGLTTPLDVIKTMLQTQQQNEQSASMSASGSLQPRHHGSGGRRYINGVGHGIRELWQVEGVRGLFRGFVPRVCLTSLQSAIMFFIYERILKRLVIDIHDR